MSETANVLDALDRLTGFAYGRARSAAAEDRVSHWSDVIRAALRAPAPDVGPETQQGERVTLEAWVARQIIASWREAKVRELHEGESAPSLDRVLAALRSAPPGEPAGERDWEQFVFDAFNSIPLYGPDADGFWLARRADVVERLAELLRSAPPLAATPVEAHEGAPWSREQLRAALEQAGQWFANYAEMHRAKCNDSKAEINQQKADYCRHAARNVGEPEQPREVPLTAEQQFAFDDYKREMTEKVIPEIVQAVGERERLAHLSRQGLLDELGTWRTLHAAWRKRAEEAEAELIEARRAAPEQPREVCWLIERGQPERQEPTCWWTENESVDWGGWTPDAHKAKRYPSRAAAEAVIARSYFSGWLSNPPSARATEHVFLPMPREGAPPTQPASQVARGEDVEPHILRQHIREAVEQAVIDAGRDGHPVDVHAIVSLAMSRIRGAPGETRGERIDVWLDPATYERRHGDLVKQYGLTVWLSPASFEIPMHSALLTILSVPPETP